MNALAIATDSAPYGGPRPSSSAPPGRRQVRALRDVVSPLPAGEMP